jgi:hypothetical protein
VDKGIERVESGDGLPGLKGESTSKEGTPSMPENTPISCTSQVAQAQAWQPLLLFALSPSPSLYAGETIFVAVSAASTMHVSMPTKKPGT